MLAFTGAEDVLVSLGGVVDKALPEVMDGSATGDVPLDVLRGSTGAFIGSAECCLLSWEILARGYQLASSITAHLDFTDAFLKLACAFYIFG